MTPSHMLESARWNDFQMPKENQVAPERRIMLWVRWLPANALAWAAGMPLIFAGMDLAQKTGSVVSAVAVMTAIIALSGVVVGAIHGRALITFVRENVNSQNISKGDLHYDR
jgi:hypothetical protein